MEAYSRAGRPPFTASGRLEANSGAPATNAEAKMADDHSSKTISALDCEIIRGAFRKSVVENRIAEQQWRMHAEELALELTDIDEIDPDVLDWIVAK